MASQFPMAPHFVPGGGWQQVATTNGVITYSFVVFQDAEDTGGGGAGDGKAPALHAWYLVDADKKKLRLPRTMLFLGRDECDIIIEVGVVHGPLSSHSLSVCLSLGFSLSFSLGRSLALALVHSLFFSFVCSELWVTGGEGGGGVILYLCDCQQLDGEVTPVEQSRCIGDL